MNQEPQWEPLDLDAAIAAQLRKAADEFEDEAIRRLELRQEIRRIAR